MNEIKQTEQKKTELETSLEKLDKEIEEQAEQLQNLKLEEQQNTNTINYYQQQVIDLKKSIETCEKKNGEIKQDKQQIEKDLQKHELKKNDIKEKIKKAEHEIKILKQKQSQNNNNSAYNIVVSKPDEDNKNKENDPIEPPEYRTYMFSTDLLVEPKSEDDISEDLKCMICQDIVNDPLECDNCQTLFCSQCVQSWRQKKDQCPLNCDKPWNLRGPHKKYKQMLSQLKFKCLFADKGCNFLVSTDNIDQHKQTCKYWKAMLDKYLEDQKKGPQKIGQFYFQADDNEWEEFEDGISEAIEENYKSNKKKFKMKFNGFDYQLDLQTMKQKNLKTNKIRSISRKEFDKDQIKSQKKPNMPKINANYQRGRDEEEELEDEEDDQISNISADYSDEEDDEDDEEEEDEDQEWCWLDEQGEYQPYKEPAKSKIENAYQTYLRTGARSRATLKLTLYGTNYTINFERETQTNAKTSFQRKIRRL